MVGRFYPPGAALTAMAGFLGPGRIALGAHFGGVDGDRQSARSPLLKPNLINRLAPL